MTQRIKYRLLKDPLEKERNGIPRLTRLTS